jgi:hypothetical protein
VNRRPIYPAAQPLRLVKGPSRERRRGRQGLFLSSPVLALGVALCCPGEAASRREIFSWSWPLRRRGGPCMRRARACQAVRRHVAAAHDDGGRDPICQSVTRARSENSIARVDRDLARHCRWALLRPASRCPRPSIFPAGDDDALALSSHSMVRCPRPRAGPAWRNNVRRPRYLSSTIHSRLVCLTRRIRT